MASPLALILFSSCAVSSIFAIPLTIMIVTGLLLALHPDAPDYSYQPARKRGASQA